MSVYCCSVLKVRADNFVDNDHLKSLLDLPTEMLIKILSYLSTRDKVTMRHVSRRLRDVSEMPLLWKEFVWADYEPRHTCCINNLLKNFGRNVRRIFFPAHMTPAKILDMTHYCTKVTHLSLPKKTQLSLDQLKEIVHTMTNLQQLDVYTSSNFIEHDASLHMDYGKFISGLLKVIAACVRELTLRIDNRYHSILVIESIELWANQSNPLPSIINILTKTFSMVDFKLFKFWSASRYKLPSFEVRLYGTNKIPMNLYPPMPVRKFQFGSAATPSLIQLNSYGIVGLSHGMFYLSEYNHCHIVKHTVTPIRPFDNWYLSLVKEQHLNHINQLHSVSYINISHSNIHSNHLEQLAIVCPNLQRLNLKGNVNCLKELQGLHAIVNTCQNLEGLNLAGIPVSSIESNVLLWELLSSLKKFTHLAINLCTLKPCDHDDADRQKFIEMFKGLHSLKALEIHCHHVKHCVKCNSNTELLFSYFPSLTHCRMCGFQYPRLAYVIANCCMLKYLYEKDVDEAYNEGLLHLSNNCRLQQLYINSPSFNLSDELADVLSTLGELEYVFLYVKSMAISGITTLINNSPNLILLYISIKVPLFNDNHIKNFREYEIQVKKTFSHRKLFVAGSFRVYDTISIYEDTNLLDTDLYSLWELYI